ncbi:amidohydrolase [Rhodococcus opacus]|nr:amidohydrolase [Rhodococcus opacus]RZL83172.1 MAG: amidohydrolase [Rhodococcus sp. (in: high G+C Gram-positive bacteria)]
MIDVHAHLFFEELLGRAGDVGPCLSHDKDGITVLTTGGYTYPLGRIGTIERPADERLAALDEAGIEIQVVSSSPLWYFPHLDADVGRPFARRYNELLAQWCAPAPGRLKALATLPVQDIPAAVDELVHAVKNLGLVGACIGTDARQNLDDPALDDLYSACEELNVPLFMHSVVAGVDGPPGDPRLRRWLRDVTLGYPFEETVAVTSLVLGGVLERHPRLDVCLSHGGGTMPFLLGRVRSWVRTGTGPIDIEEFDRNYQRLWFDTHVHSELSADLLAKVANPERLVLGTNFGGWDSSTPTEIEHLPVDLTDNSRRLLRLP